MDDSINFPRKLFPQNLHVSIICPVYTARSVEGILYSHILQTEISEVGLLFRNHGPIFADDREAKSCYIDCNVCLLINLCSLSLSPSSSFKPYLSGRERENRSSCSICQCLTRLRQLFAHIMFGLC